jgi:hypothetical protein
MSAKGYIVQLRTVNNVFRASKLPVELVKGKGYLYFVFDDGKRYDTLSVMVPRLNDLTLDRWVAEGKEFAARMTGVEHA